MKSLSTALLVLSLFPKTALAQVVTIHPANPYIADQTRGSNTAMCWIDYDAQGRFTEQPWCQVHLPRSGQATRQQYLYPGGTANIRNRVSGEPGTAVCTANFNNASQLVTVPECTRGRGGAG